MRTFKMVVVAFVLLLTTRVLPNPISISNVGNDVGNMLLSDQDLVGPKTETNSVTVEESSRFIADTTTTKVLTPSATSKCTLSEQHSISGREESYPAPQERTTTKVLTPSATSNCMLSEQHSIAGLEESNPAFQERTTTKFLTPSATSNCMLSEQHFISGLEESNPAPQERTITITSTVSLAKLIDFETNTACMTVIELCKTIVETPITEPLQGCIMDVSPAALLAILNNFKINAPCTTLLELCLSIIDTATTGSLQERTLHFIPEELLANCTGCKTDTPCEAFLGLRHSISEAAITESQRKCTINVLPAAPLANLTDLKINGTYIAVSKIAGSIVDTASTKALQEHTLEVILTLPLASCDGYNINAPCTTVLLLLEYIVNTTIPKALQERKLDIISTGSLALVYTATTEPLQEHTSDTIPTVSLFNRDVIVHTATTEPLQEHTSNTIPVVSLFDRDVIVHTATTEPLQEHTSNTIPTVSLFDRDVITSSLETSGNVLMVENRSSTDNRSPVYGRVIYALVSYIALFILFGMIITRLQTLRIEEWRSMTLISILTTLVYILGILFIFSAGMLMDGADLSNEALCRGAIYLCLIFYLGCKVIMYVFLVERAHLLRHMKRGKDVVFLVGIGILICGFGPIAGVAFKEPVAGISTVDGKCRIGLPLAVTIPLLTYDVTINVLMVGMYVFLAWPYMRGRGSPGIWLRATGLRRTTGRVSQNALLELLIWRNCYGACLVVLPTVANLAILFKIHGREQGWLCFAVCTIDVSWSVIIVHWLTAKPEVLVEAPPGTDEERVGVAPPGTYEQMG